MYLLKHGLIQVKRLSSNVHFQMAPVRDARARACARQSGCRFPSSLTNAVAVGETLSWHTVAPQALVHVVTRLPILHPVIGCCGNDQEDVPHSCTKQPSTHEAVHPAPVHAHTRTHKQKEREGT